jgi:hypothetical protein
LTGKLYLFAAQGASGTRATTQTAVQANELPYRVDSQTTRLHRITTEMTLKKPIVNAHVALGHNLAAGPFMFDEQHPVQHEHGGYRQADKFIGGIVD